MDLWLPKFHMILENFTKIVINRLSESKTRSLHAYGEEESYRSVIDLII
jgi:hypothetical protein